MFHHELHGKNISFDKSREQWQCKQVRINESELCFRWKSVTNEKKTQAQNMESLAAGLKVRDWQQKTCTPFAICSNNDNKRKREKGSHSGKNICLNAGMKASSKPIPLDPCCFFSSNMFLLLQQLQQASYFLLCRFATKAFMLKLSTVTMV